MISHYDVAIVGGGPAGSAAAIRLSQAGYRVILADHRDPKHPRIGESLIPLAQSLLAQLKASQTVRAAGHLPSFGTLSAWGDPALQGKDYIYQLQSEGWQLDRQLFDQQLRQLAQEQGVQIAEHTRLDDVVATTDGFTARLYRKQQDPAAISSRWLIDAGGRPAVLSKQLGATQHQADQLLALYAYADSNTDSDQLASTLVEAVADGWWYSALLPSRRRLVVFLTDADLLPRRHRTCPDDFLARLGRTQHIQALLHKHQYQLDPVVRGASAASLLLDHAGGERWLAVGDAALSFDPLSSKGIGNALYTGILAAQSIVTADHQGHTCCHQYLQQIERIFAVYQQQLGQFYQMETRWPASAFWQRRQSPQAA